MKHLHSEYSLLFDVVHVDDARASASEKCRNRWQLFRSYEQCVGPFDIRILVTKKAAHQSITAVETCAPDVLSVAKPHA